MNRTGLVVIGGAIAIVGYALIYHAMGSDQLKSENFRPNGEAPGFLQLLVPGAIQHTGTPGPALASSRQLQRFAKAGNLPASSRGRHRRKGRR